MSPQVDAVIRATARIQEANEPPRQKPIIKLDTRHQQELMMAHINEANQLASSIRASIDSGRDNPFRPDGEIYKLTNPIVDYYKFGPNQSRSVTPTYAELDYFSSKNKRKRRAEARREAATRPCWRRWLCCCCCRGGGSSKTAPATSATSAPKGPNEIQSEPTAAPPPIDRFLNAASHRHSDGDTVRIIEASARVAAAAVEGSDLRETEANQSSSNGNAKTMKSEPKRTRGNKSKQRTKKVVLDEESLGRRRQANHDEEDKTNAQLQLQSSSNNSKATKVKTVNTSRCVIS